MKYLNILLTVSLLSCLCGTASAHFPWLTTDSSGRAKLHFGESLDDRTYAMPASIAAAQIIARDGKPLTMKPIESDDFVGLQSEAQVDAPAELSATIVYGNYHGTELIYSVQHFVGKLPTIDPSTEQSNHTSTPLHTELIDTDSGITGTVYWHGSPLAGVEVKLFCVDGHEEATATTDDSGRVSFNDSQIEPGMGAIMVGHKVEPSTDESGTKIAGQTHYLTATFSNPQETSSSLTTLETPTMPESKSAPISVPDGLVDEIEGTYPPIPETVTSFGAAVCQDAIYLYGGHTGEAHQYDNESQASTLWRLPLNQPSEWQSMGNGPRLQGLAMVSTGGKLYQLGGFTAKNEVGEEHDLWTQDRVAAYDPTSKQWSDMPALPEPRSSFDAAVLDGQIYVVGGWTIAGDAESQWLKTAYRLDPSADSPTWVALSPPPFQRRALSVAAHGGKIYAIGGMGAEGGPSTRVDVYDPKSNQWTAGPELNGQPMDGFGSAAFAVSGRLYAATYSGLLQRLSEDGSKWEVIAKLKRDRFFHRLLPIGDNELVVLGGASMSSGKFDQLDVLKLR